MKRRDFIKSTLGAAGMLSVFPADLSGMIRTKEPGRLERRPLGRTGENLSIIGFGGIVVTDVTTEQAAEHVRKAIDAGINYFDVAPSYGNAETMLGPALQPYRDKVFLACKTQGRTKAEATKELDNSLKLMKTDRFDLYQFHAVTDVKDVQTIFGPGGAMEAFLEAKQSGKIRFIGFSAHSVEAALALMEGFNFDSILFPFSISTWHAGNFGPQVLETAKSKNMGILALKAMARGPRRQGVENPYPKCWYEPLASDEDAAMGLRFTLSHPITSAIPPGNETLFHRAVQLAAHFRPLSDAEAQSIKEKGLKMEPLFRYPATSA
jgi:aryl-alcohol dehydrogenase-like predicted oxidoreductase